jgi:hypothetical protein
VLVNQFKNYRIRVENRLRERKDVDYDEGVEEELGAHDVTDELFISSVRLHPSPSILVILILFFLPISLPDNLPSADSLLCFRA